MKTFRTKSNLDKQLTAQISKQQFETIKTEIPESKIFQNLKSNRETTGSLIRSVLKFKVFRLTSITHIQKTKKKSTDSSDLQNNVSNFNSVSPNQTHNAISSQNQLQIIN